MAIRQLFTVGYEGAELAAFLATLSGLEIHQIIDVRELPLSRKRRFSKNALADALKAQGVAYTHLKELGDPKPGREAARRGEFAEFRRIYRQHLRKVASQEALAAAALLAGKRRSSLLCFERDPVNCHRSIIAADLADRWNFSVVHIGVHDKVIRLKNQDVQHGDGHGAYAIG